MARRNPKGTFPEGQPARWPQYLPFPSPIRWGQRPVPNSNSVDWPQAQFAPKRLPPGSPSYQPYRYPDGKLTQVVWPKSVIRIGWLPQFNVQSTSLDQEKAVRMGWKFESDVPSTDLAESTYGQDELTAATSPVKKVVVWALGLGALWVAVRSFRGKPALW